MSSPMYTPQLALASYEVWGQPQQRDYVQFDHAYQPVLEREVVIKRLLPHAASNPRQRHAFMQETRTLAQLHHPNIAQVYEAGTHDEQPYVVLERLQGITLQQRIEQLHGQRATMDFEEVAQIIDGVASLVEYAHRRGVRVYNLMASNIVLTGDRQGVLESLGVQPPPDVMHLPPATLAFLAPEYVTGDVVDHRSDIYALGVLLYQLVTGRLPFEGSSSYILSQKQNLQGLPPLSDPSSELPLPYTIAHVLRQATNRRLDQRYAHVGALRQALSAALLPQTLAVSSRNARPAQRSAAQLKALRRAARRRPMHAPLRAPVIAQPAASTAAALAAAPALPPAPTSVAELVAMPTLPDAPPPAELALYSERPELERARPFTVVVPLPVAPAPEVAVVALEVTPRGGNPISRYLWLVMLMAVMLSVAAAFTLG